MTCANANMFEKKLPTFTKCADGKFYQDLVYQDNPLRRAWFICFDDKEPAEIVVRAEKEPNVDIARKILAARGFGLCVRGLMPGRKEKHQRFFGAEMLDVSPRGFDAVSWFIVFKKGIPLPTPNAYDSCVQIFSIFPNKAGVYFGDKK